MKFIIRDDDLNYFSQPDDIERWYKDIFALGIPVGFATVPFVKPISDVYPRDLHPEDKEHPISNNVKLVEYLKKNNLIEVLQHGCNHETRNGVFEYRVSQGLFEKTKRGKEELEKALEKPVNIFVPPHDAISNHGIRAVEDMDMNIIRGIGSKNILLRTTHISPAFKMFLHRLSALRKGSVFAYSKIVNYGSYKEAYSFRLKEGRESWLREGLAHANKKNGIFIVTTHLHHFSDKRKSLLMELVGEGKKIGAEFVKPSSIFN